MPDISEELRTEWREGGDKTVTVKKEGTTWRDNDDDESLPGRRSSL